jgi:hemerythrin
MGVEAVMPIQWSLDLALGIPELDGQHLQLDAYLKLLHDAICEGRVPDVGAIVAGIREASTRHFATEERLMESNGDPGLLGHRAEHRRFAERLAAFADECAREGASMPLAMRLGNWLAAWLRDHRRHDLELRRHARPGTGVGGG